MKKEEKAVRFFITNELFEKIRAEFGRGEESEGIKSVLYDRAGLKKPAPPTPEQKKAIENIRVLSGFVKQGVVSEDALKSAKAKASADLDIDFDDEEVSGLSGDSAVSSVSESASVESSESGQSESSNAAAGKAQSASAGKTSGAVSSGGRPAKK